MGNIVDRAHLFALKAHMGQRYGEFGYSYHLYKVWEKVKDHDEHTQALAWLHDVCEDTPVLPVEVEAEFGLTMADCVDALSHNKGAWEYSEYLEGLSSRCGTKGRLRGCIEVKIADMEANLEFTMKQLMGNSPVPEHTAERIRQYSDGILYLKHGHQDALARIKIAELREL